MNCCINCFSDPSLINQLNKPLLPIDDCDFCESKQVTVFACETLTEKFDQLFELYSNYHDAPRSIRSLSPVHLHEHIDLYWRNLFNHDRLKPKDIKLLVHQIGRESFLYNRELFEQPVEYSMLIGAEDLPAEDLQFKWDSFSKEIKGKNRFFLKELIDMDTLESVFSRLVASYPAGSVFYRARISDSHLPAGQLGKPPAHLTTPGRANPVGIPYLYVSESEKTTLYETRIALHEGITIGKFVAREAINLVSLKNIMEYGPFEILDRGFTLEEFIQFRPYLQKLGDELSRPVRKQDVNLDYLPTQFLCEYIKSVLEMDAVEYKSAMNADGFNLAVFNDSKLECIETKFYHVTDLNYKWE